ASAIGRWLLAHLLTLGACAEPSEPVGARPGESPGTGPLSLEWGAGAGPANWCWTLGLGTDSIELWQLSLAPSTFEQVAQFEPVAAALATAEPGGPLSAELGASLVLVGDRLLSTVDID